MGDRPVFYPDIGRFFVELREARGWSQSDAVRYAHQRGLTALSRQILLRLEGGKTKHPEPDVLRALATLYEQDYRQLVSEFVARRYGFGPDLTRHSDRSDSPDISGGVTVNDTVESARIRSLEHQVATYRAIIELAHDIGVQLVRKTSIDLPRQSTTTRNRQSRRRGDS